MTEPAGYAGMSLAMFCVSSCLREKEIDTHLCPESLSYLTYQAPTYVPYFLKGAAGRVAGLQSKSVLRFQVQELVKTRLQVLSPKVIGFSFVRCQIANKSTYVVRSLCFKSL